LKIDQLPFYWRLKVRDTKSLVPQRFPFEYDFVESLQLLIQKRNPETLAHLSKIYREDSNIGYLQDANEIAKPYGTDFSRFIDFALKQWGGSVKRILEIGCGGCTILQNLKERGYEVTGIDPGPLSVREGKMRGVPIVNDFFPTPDFRDSVDFIFHNDVLEHVPAPVEFLTAQKIQLESGGLIITAVPDCCDGVNFGEISMTMHQHLNYYDLESLRNVFEAAGLEILLLEKAAYGGSIYCCARKPSRALNFEKKTGTSKFKSFLKLSRVNANLVTSEINEAFKRKETVGFYAPLRALPYLALNEKWTEFRFFDDTEHWYNKFFDGVGVRIENFEDLKANPVDRLFIMSITFGKRIQNRIIDSNVHIPSLKILDELIVNDKAY
jgi:2-polyprenyl-3-methyl-5-hydroxy-6-metoxy-1,4-benzoquinol methylase